MQTKRLKTSEHYEIGSLQQTTTTFDQTAKENNNRGSDREVEGKFSAFFFFAVKDQNEWIWLPRWHCGSRYPRPATLTDRFEDPSVNDVKEPRKIWHSKNGYSSKGNNKALRYLYSRGLIYEESKWLRRRIRRAIYKIDIGAKYTITTFSWAGYFDRGARSKLQNVWHWRNQFNYLCTMTIICFISKWWNPMKTSQGQRIDPIPVQMRLYQRPWIHLEWLIDNT